MTDDLTASLANWIESHAAWAPLLVGALTFLESLPGISLFVPATVLLLAVGTLIGGGSLEPLPVIAAAIVGAVTGDAVGFWVSRAVGPGVVRRWLPRRHRRAYAWAMLLFRRWGWAAIFFGRFLGPVRAVAPAAAGLARMSEWRFQSANILSACIWAPTMLLPGYALGWATELLTDVPVPLMVLGLGAGAIGCWLLARRVQAAAVDGLGSGRQRAMPTRSAAIAPVTISHRSGPPAGRR